MPLHLHVGCLVSTRREALWREASPGLLNAMSWGLRTLADTQWWHINELKWISSCSAKITNLAFQPSFEYKTHILLLLQSLAHPGKAPVSHSGRETSSLRRENHLVPFAISCRIQLMKGSWWYRMRTPMHAGGSVLQRPVARDTHMNTLSFRSNQTKRKTKQRIPVLETLLNKKTNTVSQSAHANEKVSSTRLAKAESTFWHPLQKTQVKIITFPLGTGRRPLQCHRSYCLAIFISHLYPEPLTKLARSAWQAAV